MKFAFETMKGFLVCLVGSLRVEEEKEEERKGKEQKRKGNDKRMTILSDGMGEWIDSKKREQGRKGEKKRGKRLQAQRERGRGKKREVRERRRD